MDTATDDTQKEGTENALSNNTTSVPSNNAEKAPTQIPLEVKKGKREDRVKKDDKNVEQFMKSLNSVPTLEEKLSLVCKKYVQTADDNKKMQFYIKQSDKRYALLLKEKEQLQLEFNKTILVKSKLENLCRELQKQNKAIKEESLLKIREEEERRKETQAKFQNTLSEITAMLQQNNEKNAKLRDDNISMSEKFKSVVQQYQLREQQVEKMAKQMALESQLSDAKLQKASLEHQADKERLLAEMEQIKVTVAQYRAKIKELQGTETSLRSQLAVYTDKYDEFQNALVKSNQMFGGFKEQMEKMSKKIKKLEKESLSWKSRWESSQTALLDMCGERQASEERAAAAARQLAHMQGLCRTLQAERGALLLTLKEHNIERPALAAAPPAPPAAPARAAQPASNAKVDAMAANCAQLRQSLAHLQTQLNTLTNQQKEEAAAKQEKPEKVEKKKSKSKKNKAEKAKAEAEKADVPKETESDESNAKDLTDDVQDATNGTPTEKVDEATLENLIQAINSANINLCDLEVVNDEISDETSKENSEKLDTDGKPEDVKESTSSEISLNPSPVEEQLLKDVTSAADVDTPSPAAVTNVTNDVKTVPSVVTNTPNDVTNVPSDVAEVTNINDVTKAITKLLNDAKDVSITNGCENQNVSKPQSSNDEVSHLNEVKPIASDA
ncbi:gamma-taxilin [Trichoplusia ni]|uniref:Gamma-taxilin n=1 Tax=Trichoplusia ni TaxID=7111 RepID=A0A7E5W4D6_TRINI|nr:gamma-taxilin [Trichoplusia ni]